MRRKGVEGDVVQHPDGREGRRGTPQSDRWVVGHTPRAEIFNQREPCFGPHGGCYFNRRLALLGCVVCPGLSRMPMLPGF